MSTHQIFSVTISPDNGCGNMAVNIYLDRNAGSNNSDSALPRMEDDTDAGRSHVRAILCIPRASHPDRILPKPVFRIVGGEMYYFSATIQPSFDGHS